MAILCVANQKGGVGKTTTAVNLAAGLSRRGGRVLLVDLDLQGSATATLLGPVDPADVTLADCLIAGRRLEEAVRPSGVERLDVAPSGEALATVDLHLATAMAREQVLKRLLAPTAATYDHVVIDTAPYLGLLTLNALVAADHIVVPVSCEYLPILGLKLFGETLARVRTGLGVPCHVLGYLLTMYDRREKITTEVEAILRRTFGEQLFPQPIRLSTRHKIAPSHRKTIYDFEKPNGRGRVDYEALCDEVLRRLAALEELSFAGLGEPAAAAATAATATATATAGLAGERRPGSVRVTAS